MFAVMSSRSMQKQPSCIKTAAFISLDEKSCEIKGGGHEKAVMMLMIVNTYNGCVH